MCKNICVHFLKKNKILYYNIHFIIIFTLKTILTNLKFEIYEIIDLVNLYFTE